MGQQMMTRQRGQRCDEETHCDVSGPPLCPLILPQLAQAAVPAAPLPLLCVVNSLTSQLTQPPSPPRRLPALPDSLPPLGVEDPLLPSVLALHLASLASASGRYRHGGDLNA